MHVHNHAKIAQLVERHLAKVEVAGSNPVFRSGKRCLPAFFYSNAKFARVVELVDTPDLKSCDHLVVRVQVPPRVQRESQGLISLAFLLQVQHRYNKWC